MSAELSRLEREISRCTLCPRLVEWRERVAADPPKRYRGERYWARPVPAFGDPEARLVIVGLAPAAHGANRTGRMFTGDRSGDWLYAALHRAGLASQPTSIHSGDGLELRGVWITAVNRCAPPANRPTPAERDNCLPFLAEELALLDAARSILALGAFGWDGAMRALAALGHDVPRPRPRFGHEAVARVGPYRLVGCFHPSQQNTFTGKLTEAMLDLAIARALGGEGARDGGRRGHSGRPPLEAGASEHPDTGAFPLRRGLGNRVRPARSRRGDRVVRRAAGGAGGALEPPSPAPRRAVRGAIRVSDPGRRGWSAPVRGWS